MMLSSRCVMHALRTRRTSNKLNLLKFCSKVDGSEQKPPTAGQPTTDQATADKDEEELLRALEIRSQRYSAAIKTLAPVVVGMYLIHCPTVCVWLVPGLFYQSWIKEDSTGVGEWLQNRGPQRAVEKGKQAWDNWNPDVRKIVMGGVTEGALKRAVEASGLMDLVDELSEPYATIAKVSMGIAQKGVRHTITSYLVQDDGVKQRMDMMEKKFEEMMTVINQQQEEIRILKAVPKKKESDDVSVGDDQGLEEDVVSAKENVMDDGVVEDVAVGANKEVIMDDSGVEEVADVVSTGEIGKQEEEE